MSRLAVFFLMIIASVLAICLAFIGFETLKDNILGWFLMVFGLAYIVGGIIYYFVRHEPFWKSSNESKTTLEDKGDTSFWAILPGFLVVFFAPPCEWMFIQPLVTRPLWAQYAGLVMILVAISLLVWARIHIRGLYSGHVSVQADHRLVKSGPYHFIRHPSYCGLILMSLGLVIGYVSLIGLFGFIFILLPGMAYRIKIEEKLLFAKFGSSYQEYSSRTNKILPGIW